MKDREFEHKEGDMYDVTGILKNGDRFVDRYKNPHVALAINLWKGSVWQVRNGKRKLIKRVFN